MVSAFPLLTMFVVALALLMLAAFALSELRMSRPSVEVTAYCGRTDVYPFTRIEVSRGCWAKLQSVRQVDLNPNTSQSTVRGVFHVTGERIRPRVVAQDQSSTVPESS